MDRLGVALTVLSVSMLTNAAPPVWSSAFSVDFQEKARLSFVTLFINNGSWYYNFDNKQARFDHLRGQKDWFCMNQHLSDHDKQAPCNMLFSNDTNLYIHYPEAKTCCRLCGLENYCTVMEPNWLKNATFIGDEMFYGSKCHGWQTPGFTFMDTWYVTDENVPCQYHEKSDHLGTIHNITFNQKSFNLGPPNPDIFNVPSYCHKECPNPFKGQKRFL